eukprot:TRINITY_DN45627_c0_g1_i1.p2 TRINITY_DN45627_c0_g1~~TRINITY_DN45627_c0_g1_i1.p2  ORF type:complete len:152 (+),score=4.16 TRINITY_DN45627_c0_g1_i1:157-612(+)
MFAPPQNLSHYVTTQNADINKLFKKVTLELLSMSLILMQYPCNQQWQLYHRFVAVNMLCIQHIQKSQGHHHTAPSGADLPTHRNQKNSISSQNQKLSPSLRSCEHGVDPTHPKISGPPPHSTLRSGPPNPPEPKKLDILLKLKTLTIAAQL